MNTQSSNTSMASRWFLASLVLLILFLGYTAIFSSGAFLVATIRQEQWLLHRPLTGVDCVFDAWATADEGPFSLLLLLFIGILCLRLGYRRMVLFYLLLLFALCIGIELIGKQIFLQPVPRRVEIGLQALDCPQVGSQLTYTKVLIFMGMGWLAPPASQQSVLEARIGSTPPFSIGKELLVVSDNSYPSGHAIRWSFLGVIACWLISKHMRHRNLRILRVLLMALALLYAISGGFSEFYTGNHYLTDIVAGYLLGFGCACFAIGLLMKNDKRIGNRSGA